jgi:transcriptional regulator with XRE-family HTH domain
MSQRELAGPGVSYAYISRIEKGHRSPSLKAVRILADKLGVTPEYLETGAPMPATAERELRLGDAELELRLHRDLNRARLVFEEELQRDDSEPALQARGHAGLGLLAWRSDNADAVRHLEQATGSGYFPPETRPDLYETLGAAYTAANEPNRAVDLYRRCLGTLRERAPTEASLQVRFGVYLACAYSELGASDRARAALAEASETAENGSADPQTKIDLYWTAAREAWFEADSHGAFSAIHRAIGILETTEDTYKLARAHLLAAQLMNLDGRGAEAGLHLERAERLLVLGAEDSDLGVLRAEQARRAAQLEDGKEAMARANEAERLLGDDARYLGLKWHALGSAYRLAGDTGQAEGYFGRALDVLKERRQWRETSTVAREWARLLRTLGRDSDAFDLMEEASYLNARHMGDETIRTVRRRRNGV